MMIARIKLLGFIAGSGIEIKLKKSSLLVNLKSGIMRNKG